MPYRRSYRPRARARPRRYRKRTYKRRMYRRKLPRNQITSAMFRFVMPIIQNSVNSTVGTAVAGHIAPAFSDMPGSTCYKALFAQYRVNKIKVEFIPQVSRVVTTVGSSDEVSYERPMFATSVNRVATSFPQDFEEIMSTSSVRYTQCGKYMRRYITPCTFDTIFNGSFSTEGLNPEYKQWISTNYAGVAHHGVSYVISAASHLPDGMYKYMPVVTMYAQFKNRRVNTDNISSTLPLADPSDNFI